MKNGIQLLALAALTLCLGGCASSSIKHTWKSPTRGGGPVQKMAVLTVDDADLVRVALENRFVREMREHGQDAVATRDLLGLPELKADKEAASARLRAAGADAVLLVRLVGQATYSHEVAATPGIYTSGASGNAVYGWYDYLPMAFAGMGMVWSSTDQNLYLDSSLFDLKTGQRLWSALTLTVVKEDMDRLQAADSLVAKIAKAMRKEGFVR